MPRAAPAAPRPSPADRGPLELHAVAATEAARLVETDPDSGLTREAAAERLLRHGPNLLPARRRRGPAVRVLLQLSSPLVQVLIVAGVVTLLIGRLVDASVILGVVVLNAVIGFLQESRAERALDALVAMTATDADVVREGRRWRVPSSQLVLGDVLLLEPGDKVAADVRLLSVRDLRIDESVLTGESVPVPKTTAPSAPRAPLPSRTGMAFAGTLVVAGRGRGVVGATAAATELGRIHGLMGATTGIATPLTRKISRFSRLLTVVIVVLAAIAFAVGLARGEPAPDMFVAAVALAVGAIPEGLPAAITITLAIGVSRMATRHAVVRTLPAVETLGSTTVICSDKTGTLTENQMTVQAVVAGGERLDVEGTGYAPGGRILRGGDAIAADAAPALRACLMAGALANDARVAEREGRWEAIGDPTEAALIVSAGKGGLDAAALARDMPREAGVPFESGRRMMATVHRAGDERVLYVKGAIEAVLPLADRQLDREGREVPLDAGAALAAAEGLAAEGLRVLALAAGPAPRGDATDALETRGLVLLGLQGMMDPPRPEAIVAVRACRSAGIAVKMITGDHAATARAIASRMGIGEDDPEGPTVLTGVQLADLSADELSSAVGRTAVFARVSPEQKLELVGALQSRGEIVAMTGDGVNDAPALAQADIGVAMGRDGTDVAREAADIVLTDDDFASIAAAVREGRRVVDNLTKFIVWTLPTNLAEGLVILAAILAGATLPILPVQILWINMTTAVALGLMLAFEPEEPDVMRRPPRDPARPLLTAELLARIALVSGVLLLGSFGLFEWELAQGATVDEARTAAVDVFVAGQVFYLFSCRSLHGTMPARPLGNRWLLTGVATMIVLQLGFTYAPFMHRLFASAPVDADTWAAILVCGLAVSAIVEVQKRSWRHPRMPGRPPELLRALRKRER